MTGWKPPDLIRPKRFDVKTGGLTMTIYDLFSLLFDLWSVVGTHFVEVVIARLFLSEPQEGRVLK